MENPFQIILEKLNAIEIAIENLKLNNEVKAESKYIGVDEVAAYLNLSKSSIYGLVHQKKIPHYKVGKKLYFEKSEIDTYIMKNKIMTTDDLNLMADQYILERRK